MTRAALTALGALAFVAALLYHAGRRVLRWCDAQRAYWTLGRQLRSAKGYRIGAHTFRFLDDGRVELSVPRPAFHLRTTPDEYVDAILADPREVEE